MNKSDDNSLAAWADIILGKSTKCSKCSKKTIAHRSYDGPLPKCKCGADVVYKTEGKKNDRNKG